MPQFTVSGTSRKGRKVARAITAQTVTGARKIAERDGVTVQNVDRLPPEPATDSQLSYARSLGIGIPPSPSLDEMSNLISKAVEPLASDWLVNRARVLEADIDPERYPGVEYFSRQPNGALGVNTPAFHRERVFWYLHGVLRYRRKGSWSSPDESGIVDSAIWAVVEAFVEDAAAFKRCSATVMTERRISTWHLETDTAAP
jgi:hypothetical protein